MSISMNLGNWNSVFAVPSTVVDDHIKLAGSAQLKVLLWILRHSGEDFSTEDISSALSMHKADVKDSMQYWIENNLICVVEDEIKPGRSIKEVNMVDQDQKTVQDKKVENDIKSKGEVIRHAKLDMDYVNKRLEESEDVKYLIQEAEVVLSRPISNNDISSFITFHDIDGLPFDVIIMLLQYAVSVGKDNMNYITRVANDWGNEGIDSVEKVDKKIEQLTEKRKAWVTVEKIIGIEHRAPTSKEDEMANRWINEWHIKKELINEAYERCVNAKGKYISSYIDTIIKKWRDNGITTIGQAVEERKKQVQNPQRRFSSYTPSYNIEKYENESMFD